ncbi:hypothetical protein Tco_0217604 [Tanacetum coccineum]
MDIRRSLISSTDKPIRKQTLVKYNVEDIVRMICHKKLIEAWKTKTTPEVALRCVVIGPREQPTSINICASSVYVDPRPDTRLFKLRVQQKLLCGRKFKGNRVELLAENKFKHDENDG